MPSQMTSVKFKGVVMILLFITIIYAIIFFMSYIWHTHYDHWAGFAMFIVLSITAIIHVFLIIDKILITSKARKDPKNEKHL